MTGILTQQGEKDSDTKTPQVESHVMMEAQTGVMPNQAKPRNVKDGQ